MTLFRLIIRNLWHHRKPWIAILAGVAVSTAVLSGALIVGDSVRFSLQRLTEMRLGNIRYALTANDRFFTSDLASRLSADTKLNFSPVLQAPGIAINSDLNERINQVQVLGINARFIRHWSNTFRAPGVDSAVISRNVAEKLRLKPGDNLLVRIRKTGRAPSNAPFVAETEPAVAVRVTVSAIAEDQESGRFSLASNQSPPYNIYLSLDQMASMLELRGLANMLLVSGNGSPAIISTVDGNTLKKHWQPADAGLEIGKTRVPGTFRVTTDRIFFDEQTLQAILKTLPGSGSYLTYLVNSITLNEKETPYSFVTACSDQLLGQPIDPDGVIINEWLARDLGAGPGDTVGMRYFLMGPLKSLREDSIRLVVRSVVPMDHILSDPALMPDFPGMSEAGNCRDWETGAPVNLKKIRDKDESYWKTYRGTPKAYISLETGQRIWGNKYGNHTGFRFTATEDALPGIGSRLMQHLDPARSGLVFRPVYDEGQAAAANSTDFGELFLSLSFFILFSALLLTAMLFAFMTRMRMAEAGIFTALGFTKMTVMKVFAGEACIVAFTGAVVGTLAAVLYNYLLIIGLNTIWQEAVNTSMLVMKISPPTLLTGAIIAILVSLATMLAGVRRSFRNPLSMLVKGVPEAGTVAPPKRKRLFALAVALVSFGGSMAILVWPLITGSPHTGEILMIAGGLLLPGMLAFQDFLLSQKHGSHAGKIPGFNLFIFRNLSTHRGRTVTTVALLALGTFSIIITGANRQGGPSGGLSYESGTGGFLLWAETTLPLNHDLNTPRGAEHYGLHDEASLQDIRYIQLARLEGDDASCLNLNQVASPGLLGVPAVLFDEKHRFRFITLDPLADKNHPWTVLSKPLASDVIPGFADQSVITWGLRKSVGDTLFYRDESGKILKIKLVGGLENSIFQGSILVSDSLLRRFFPSAGGSRVMLVDGPSAQSSRITETLETRLRDYGMMVTPAPARLASFNAVENTYLSVFMMLGGLGVMIGTIGLGIVLIRSISDRKRELSICLALGLGRKYILKLMIAEHLLLLFDGLLTGLVAALPVILPLLFLPGNKVPWLSISIILSVILLNGLLWIMVTARATVPSEPVSGLRAE